MILRTGLGDTSSIQAMLDQAAAQYNVPSALLKSVAQQESGLNPNAVSSKGAIGVMQLMPTTAAGLGVSDPYDPQQNIDGGAKYLSQLLTQFGGDQALAVAAYNAGPGAVQQYGGIPPYTATQNYVAAVLAGAGDTSQPDVMPISADSTTVDYTVPILAAIGVLGFALALS